MEYRLRPSVSVVDLGDNILEFFKTNTRKSIKIRINNDLIKRVVLSLDGNSSVEQLSERYKFDPKATSTTLFFSYLKEKAILANDYYVRQRSDYIKYRRVIHFLEDFSKSDEDLLEIWNNIRNARVTIIGVGAVGSWVAANLVQSGVKNLVLVDDDRIELSNLHRQFGYTESDIGKDKITVLKERLMSYEKEANIYEYHLRLDKSALNKIEGPIDLVINCADKPTVDQTSEWVGEFCMKKRIPHIVGGGYNLHLSLIGQTILPFQTACVNCFKKQLEEANSFDGTKVKKLNIKNRNIGSFGPMCTVIASMIGMEAIKVLSKRIQPDNINRRGEFNIYDMDIKYTNYSRLSTCAWCGGLQDERD